LRVASSLSALNIIVPPLGLNNLANQLGIEIQLAIERVLDDRSTECQETLYELISSRKIRL
jgi:hypothetical protein